MLRTRIERLERQVPPDVADEDESPYGWAYNCRKIIECCEQVGPRERYMDAALVYLLILEGRASPAYPDLRQRWQRLNAGEVVNAGPCDPRLEQEAECAVRSKEHVEALEFRRIEPWEPTNAEDAT